VFYLLSFGLLTSVLDQLAQIDEQLRAQRMIHAKEVKKLTADNKTLSDEVCIPGCSFCVLMLRSW
jgi:hypothetical protein